MSSGPISHIGTLYNTTNQGFSNMDLIRELIDNSLDANASEIQIHMIDQPETSTYLITVGDNAQGMTRETLQTSLIINNRKDACDDKNGLFGFGGIAALFGLTLEGGGKATILSKINGETINELLLDFPSIIRNNNITYIAHEVSVSMNTMWNNYAVNKNHGTLIILECNPLLVSNMIEQLPLENLGRTYYAYIDKNIKLTLMVNGKLLKEITSNNVIDGSNATYTKKHEINVWKKEQDVIAEFKNGNGTKVHFDLEEKKAKPTNNLYANGYREIGKINYTNSVKFNLIDKTTNWPIYDGGYYLKRNKKVINKIEIPYPTSGDYAYKDLRASSKHLVEFTTNLDTLFGIQVNKSKIDKNLINTVIFKTLEHLAMDFCKKYWDRIKQPIMPVTPVRPAAPRQVTPVTPRQVTPRQVTPLTPVTPVTPVAPKKGDELEDLQVKMAILATTPKPPPFTFMQPNPVPLPQPQPILQQLPSIEELIEASENHTNYLKKSKTIETLKNSKTLQIYTLQCEVKIN